jgi:hypothetical protein
VSAVSQTTFGFRIEPQEGRRLRSVVGWAWLGAAFLAVEAWAIGGWLLSGDATPTPRGTTPVPDWMLVSIRTIEAATGIGMLAVFWFFLVRPWLRDRSITRDGWMCLVFCSMAWQDSLLNYFQHWFAYNAALFNFGSWNSHVLGWMSPHGNRIANPLLFYGGYGSVIFAGVVLGNAFVRRVVARRPGLTRPQIVGVTFGFYAVFGMIEMVFLRAGMYAYPGGIKGLTLFHGHYYQYPVYEGLAFVSLMTAWGCMRWFRNDRGETLAERGMEHIGGSERRRTFIRVLAFAGLGNFIFVVCYSGPMAIAGLYSDPWPADVVKRSYLTDGLCGPGTDYACAGPSVPIPRRGSAHLRPDGTLAPAGQK